jgi:hypothetical protein
MSRRVIGVTSNSQNDMSDATCLLIGLARPYLRRAGKIQTALAFDAVSQASGQVLGGLNRGADRDLVTGILSRPDGAVEVARLSLNTVHDDGLKRIVLGIKGPTAGDPLELHLFQRLGNVLRR